MFPIRGRRSNFRSRCKHQTFDGRSIPVARTRIHFGETNGTGSVQFRDGSGEGRGWKSGGKVSGSCLHVLRLRIVPLLRSTYPGERFVTYRFLREELRASLFVRYIGTPYRYLLFSSRSLLELISICVAASFLDCFARVSKLLELPVAGTFVCVRCYVSIIFIDISRRRHCSGE